MDRCAGTVTSWTPAAPELVGSLGCHGSGTPIHFNSKLNRKSETFTDSVDVLYERLLKGIACFLKSL